MILTARSRGIPVPIILAVAGAWSLVVVAQETGNASRLHHDSLIEGGPPLWAALAVFLLAWQAMIAAMMLPSSLPMVRLFTHAAGRQPRPGVATAAFVGGYAMVWTGFGVVAFLGDVGIHRTVDTTPWLATHEWFISAGVLIAAGAFQFTDLKDRCLDQCRHPGPFLMRHYRRGTGGAFALGRRHGVFCLGCCWALMLLMFAAGVASLVWMAVLGAVMYYEKAGRHGRAITPVVGVALVCWGILVAAHPAWLPGALAGVAS